jgi:hypothetical protein
VLRPTVDELLNSADYRFSLSSNLVLVPEPHQPIRDGNNPPFCDGWTPYITASVAQKVFLSVERLDVDSPAANFLLL